MSCYLCRKLGPPNGRKVHGFSLEVEGLAMVDFSCPTTEEAYDRDIAALAEVAREMRKQPPGNPEPNGEP